MALCVCEDYIKITFEMLQNCKVIRIDGRRGEKEIVMMMTVRYNFFDSLLLRKKRASQRNM